MIRRRLTPDELDSLEGTAEKVKVFRHKLAEGAGASGNIEPFVWHSREFRPKEGKHFSTRPDGMARLSRAERLIGFGKSLPFVNFLADHSVTPVTTTWPDTVVSGFSDPQLYVVQTATKVIERCLLMMTDPGDLVLHPTCGSGTTAYVAEQWGRRWITCDTSRVALALARQRLMTARFTYYQLRELSAEDLNRNKDGTWIAELGGEGKPTGKRLTFQCKTVPHIFSRSLPASFWRNSVPQIARAMMTWSSRRLVSTPPLRTPLKEAAIRSCDCTWRSFARTMRPSVGRRLRSRLRAFHPESKDTADVEK
ncbi:MAG: hypothetical protein HYY23_19045 [Verrucomicrobia bacterium]|nr:hypothetical protein [Verrucomicrobiota bacterium]